MTGPTYDVRVTSLGGTPVFQVYAPDPRFMKVFGATEIDGLWYYPAFLPAAEVTLKDFRVLRLPLNFSPAAQKAVATLQDLRRRHDAGELPPNFVFKTKPYQHQLDGLVHLLYYWRAALFYACGLGKTKVVVDWMRAVRCWTLVVCPKIVVGVWGREVQTHGIDQELRIVDADTVAGREKQLLDAEGYQGAVLSYDTLVRLPEAIVKLPYTAMVADESQYLKSADAERTRVALELGMKAARRVLMSGTPSLGDPCDMWSQLRFLSTAYASEAFWAFKQTYCQTSPRNKHIVVGYKNLDGLHLRVELVALRRTKEECLDLPKRLTVERYVELRGKARTLYNELTGSREYQDLIEQLRDQALLSPGAVLQIPHAAALLNKLLQISAGFVYAQNEDDAQLCDGCPHLRECVADRIRPHTRACKVHSSPAPPQVERFAENAKRDMLEELLESVLADPSNKAIVWGQYLAELDLIEDLLKERGWGYVRIDGRTAGTAAAAAAAFNNEPDRRVYLGQVSTGVGITLNAANYMIYYSLPWKLGDYEQSGDRNYRVGQERDTVIYLIIAQGTVDEAILRALRAKHDVAEALTAAIVCQACPAAVRCAERGTAPFDDDCRYPRGVSRPIAKAKPLD
jgi:SNF2 family DNA or RNA helicase